MSLIVFAFHYNRGQFLENLVSSIERHIPDAPLVIFDDGSTEPESVDILKKLEARHEVQYPAGGADTEFATGGLHANMTRAMNLARDRGFKYALFVQDDMQIVRNLDDQDFDVFERAFKKPNASFVLVTAFRKTQRGRRTHNVLVPTAIEGVCERPDILGQRKSNIRPIAYVDSGLFNVELFFAQLGKFETGERENEEKMAKLGLRMSFMVQPLMFFLPLPITFRGGVRNRSARFCDKLAGAGVYPINPITRENLMGHSELAPFAEDVLVAPDLPKVKYWSLRGGRANLKSRKGWRGLLGRFMPK